MNAIPCDPAHDEETNAEASLLNEIQASLKKYSGLTSRQLLPVVCQFSATLIKENAEEKGSSSHAYQYFQLHNNPLQRKHKPWWYPF